MQPFPYPAMLNSLFASTMLTQMNSLCQMNSLHNQQFINPLLLNQMMLAQQMSLLMMQKKQVDDSQASSTRTIQLEDLKQVKLEEGLQIPDRNNLEVDKLTTELSNLINYLTNAESISQKFLDENFQTLHHNNQTLVRTIAERFLQQKKTKEEQIKFVLRKCFKFIKNKLDIKDGSTCPLDLEKRLYKEYFGGDEDMIPFRENSNMKTMNAHYLKKIFQSPRFVEAFTEYLDNFDKIWDEENDEKIDNMVKQVVKFIQHNKIQKIQNYRRIPWVPQIKEKCKELAFSMLRHAPSNENPQKKLQKTEEPVLNE